jgi:CPA2 family monovalent cation:H+ antiporter-2
MQNDALQPAFSAGRRPHAIIAGFGLPGRAAAERFEAVGLPYCVIEINPQTVQRAAKSGVVIIEGDVAQEGTLRRAGIATAVVLVIAIPDENAAVEATNLAHRLNPATRIITRCHYTSKGLEAKSRGATEVVIAEQVAAVEMSRLTDAVLAMVDAATD